MIRATGDNPAVDVECAVSLLRGADTRGRGTQQQRDALRAVTCARSQYMREKVVLLQPKPRQSIVATFPDAVRRWQRCVFHASNPSDPACQRYAAEIICAQCRALTAQGVQMRVQPAAHGRSSGVRGNRQRGHRSGHRKSVTVIVLLA